MPFAVESCPICFEPLNDERPPHAILPCGHIFCEQCLLLSEDDRCALCKSRHFSTYVRLYMPEQPAPSGPTKAVQKMLDDGLTIEERVLGLLSVSEPKEFERAERDIKDWLQGCEKLEDDSLKKLERRLRIHLTTMTRILELSNELTLCQDTMEHQQGALSSLADQVSYLEHSLQKSKASAHVPYVYSHPPMTAHWLPYWTHASTHASPAA